MKTSYYKQQWYLLVTILSLAISPCMAQDAGLSVKKSTGDTGIILENNSGGNTILSLKGNERLRLTEDGKLGINTNTEPLAAFHIGGTQRLNALFGSYSTIGQTGGGLATILGNNVIASPTDDNQLLFLSGGTDGGQAIKMMYNEGISFHTFNDGQNHTAGATYTGNERMRIDLAGNVGINNPTPATRLDVNGSITLNGNLLQLSDARFKKDIQTISAEMVNNIDSIRGTYYEFDHNQAPGHEFAHGTQYGFIAQELMNFYPEVVNEGANGFYTVNYNSMIPVLVETIKDLRAKNAALNTTVDQTTSELSALSVKHNKLQKKVNKMNKKLNDLISQQQQ